MNILNYIKLVKTLKSKFQSGQHFHCTLALKGGNIIAIGINNYNIEHPRKHFGVYRQRQHDNRKEYKPRLHSEIDCLKQIQFREDLNKLTLLNIRIDNKDQISNAEPCENCKKVLSKYKFKRIYFTINNKILGRFLTD